MYRHGEVDDDDLAVPVHDDPGPVLLLRDLDAREPHGALVARLEGRLVDTAARRRASDVERPHRELRARLADRLGRDDADRLADVHHVPARQIASVTLDADAAPRTTGQRRTDRHRLDARIFDLLDARLVELVVRMDENLAGQRVEHVLERNATEDTLAELL